MTVSIDASPTVLSVRPFGRDFRPAGGAALGFRTFAPFEDG